MTSHNICVCICTYRRSEWLRRLLQSLQRQQTGGLFSYSIAVTDNDSAESARATVAEFATTAVPATYCVEPIKNIALARNRAIAAATGNWIAFIDDDEFPVDDWLLRHFKACTTHGAQGVLGPVRPHFEAGAPAWVATSGIYNRIEYESGFTLSWREARTGNVLFRRDILPTIAPPFSPEFPNGGEDQDFFRRMMEHGHHFIWCNEAIVYETVPPARWDKKVLMQRALLRGKNTLKHADVTLLDLFKSIIAVIAYSIALPFLALIGTHLFMRYLVRLCDHLGKLLAVIGINPVHERAG